MATYLEDYLDSIITLPSEIKRNFELMRELDEGAHVLTEEVEQMQKDYLVDAREKVQQRYHESTSSASRGNNRTSKPPPDEQELLQLVEENDEVLLSLKTKRQKVFQKMDEKIAIAAQTYDLVDYHIRRLDEDLVRFKSQLQHAQLLEDEEDELLSDLTSELDTRASNVESNILLDPFESNPPSQVSENGFFPTATPQRRKKDFESTSVLAGTAGTVPVAEDLPIDPNEPLYCKCRRVSYGQMVGCDNDDCKYEWFHYDCVGLKSPPQGKWYCQDCIDIGFGN